MISFDWTTFGLGIFAGSAVGVLFFSGLALGIRLAMRTSRPTPFLMLSAMFRIVALLGVCWLVANQGGGLMLTGFALAFVIVRFVAITIASVAKPKQVPQWK